VAPYAKVIGIAGPPGAGKSTLADALVRALGDAVRVSMDDYQRFTEMPIDAVARWLERGADHDELAVPLLAEHLARLRAGEPVAHPVTGRVVAPRRHVVFETHFGRAHAATGSMIDLLVWIDTPPDIALARNLRGFVAQLSAVHEVQPLRDEVGWIADYLAQYEGVVGRLVAIQARRVRPQADLVLGVDVAVAVAAQRVADRISAMCGRNRD
jgi:hypothetical protein